MTAKGQRNIHFKQKHPAGMLPPENRSIMTDTCFDKGERCHCGSREKVGLRGAESRISCCRQRCEGNPQVGQRGAA